MCATVPDRERFSLHAKKGCLRLPALVDVVESYALY